MKSWFFSFFTSSIGKKLIMSLTGLFLIIFLVIHLAGNIQLLYDDNGRAFNLYAKFMTTNPVIKTISFGLYFFILLHAIQGWMLWRNNRAARGSQRYAVLKTRGSWNTAGLAKNMGWLGTIVFIFLVIHLYQFWFKMKFGFLEPEIYDDVEVINLFTPVKAAFTDLGFVIFYVVSMLIVALHLWHGFQSSFQTLGWNHPKYMPIIKFAGKAYSVLIPLGFAIIPIVFYLKYA